MREAKNADPHDYSSFNEFFTRALKAQARPIAQAPDTIISPADGTISELGQISAGKLIQAKGMDFSLVDLLGGSAQTAESFQGGSFATIYLAPKDYHRVHMPFAGILKQMIYIPGNMFSVNQTTAGYVPNLFARNERAVCLFDTELGPMAVILVGALIVAAIETVWAGQVAPAHLWQKGRQKGIHIVDYDQQIDPIQLAKGDELGRFKLGSTAILLFAADAIKFLAGEKSGANKRMGEALAIRRKLLYSESVTPEGKGNAVLHTKS